MRMITALTLMALLCVPVSAVALVAVETEPPQYLDTVPASDKPAQVQDKPEQPRPGKGTIKAAPKPQKKGQGAAPKQ